jgi:putative ABC transport system permease protein
MLFLILALSIGLFNANAARTINSNTEDTIRSTVGSDIQVQEFWQPYNQDGTPQIDTSAAGMPQQSSDAIVKFIEPNFTKYKDLDGIDHAARVYRSDGTRISQGGSRSDTIELMAIDPYDFANTAWSRNDMFSYHMNDYMNVMMSMPNGIILSANLREKLDLTVGDSIIYTVNNRDNADGVIIAFVEYWPGYQPKIVDRNGNLAEQYLMVASLDFMLTNTAMQPYEVWLRREPQALDSDIYDAIQESRINLVSIRSSNQEITARKMIRSCRARTER